MLVTELPDPGAPVTVAEAILPEGASPPAHVHAALDDSFYILDGRMVLHCGDDVWQAGPGSRVQFPATQGPTLEELDRALAAHGITNVGPPMEQFEAERLLEQLAGAAIAFMSRRLPCSRHDHAITERAQHTSRVTCSGFAGVKMLPHS